MLGLIAAIGGTVLGAYGQAKAGDAANKAGKYNQQTYEQNARFTEAEKPIVSENARTERRRLAEQYHAVVGDFRTRTAASGFDPNFGSSQALQDDAKRAYDIDRRILAKNEVAALRDKDVEAYNYRRSGAVARMEGRAARDAGYLGAATTLLQGAATVSQMLPSGKGK